MSALVFLYFPWEYFISHKAVLTAGICIAIAVGAGLTWFVGAVRTDGIDLSNWNVSHPLRTLGYIVAAGAALRIVYFAVISPIPIVSDAAHYLDIARRLVGTGVYAVHGTLPGVMLSAARPPGYPLFLVPLVWLFDGSGLSIFIAHLAIYIAVCWITFALARDLMDERTGLVAAGLVAMWPSFIFFTGLALSEPLAILLVVVNVWALWRSVRDEHWLSWAAVAGISAGAAALLKPNFLYYPFLWAIFLLGARLGFRKALPRLLIASLLMAAVIGPWTARNYRVLHGWLPISSNGGSVFYRANNPLASGGFTPRGERDLAGYERDELAWNRIGMQWGYEWIERDPLGFLKLVLHKQRIFLASDDSGGYLTFALFVEKDPQSTSAQRAVSTLLVAVQNAWWLSLWFLILASLLKHRTFWLNAGKDGGAMAMLLFPPVLALLAVHSVYESQPRYHMPVVALLCVIAAMALQAKPPAKHV